MEIPGWLYETKELAINDYRSYVSKGKAKFYARYRMELVMGERGGCYFQDVTGKRFLNCHCNGGVFNLGHKNPAIVAALQEALETWDMGNHHLMSAPRAYLGKMLADHMPGDMGVTVFGVSGGEAVDLAIKLARAHTGRSRIISTEGGYHGHTGFALATGDEKFREPFGPMAPGFDQVRFGDLDALKEAMDDDTAGVIMETIPATNGIVVPDEDYFQGVRDLCDEVGAAMIVDEIQSGLGRTGKLWGIEHYGVEPDIITVGKGLSGGIYPITATCFRPEYDEVLQKKPFIHISTFGGSELGCLVGAAVLKECSSPPFLNHVNEMAVYLGRRLEELRETYTDRLIEIRQLGLMIGLRFATEEYCMVLCKALYDKGVYTVFSANDRRVLQFLPPLIIDRKVADLAVDTVGETMKMLTSKVKYRVFLGLARFLTKTPV